MPPGLGVTGKPAVVTRTRIRGYRALARDYMESERWKKYGCWQWHEPLLFCNSYMRMIAGRRSGKLRSYRAHSWQRQYFQGPPKRLISQKKSERFRKRTGAVASVQHKRREPARSAGSFRTRSSASPVPFSTCDPHTQPSAHLTYACRS